MNYAFNFDASACSGCKACQEACKDKNNLPAGILWRRVIEISGGEWRNTGSAWENSVFAYNLSLSCNHCTHPKCAGVCPTDAFTVRPDGIVLLDGAKCMGCGYCSWACPYGAPQYDAARGVMTKCDFCYDSIDAGLLPTCVSACPLRVLDYRNLEELSTSSTGKNLWQLPASEHPFPLPEYSRTEPHLSIKPHAGMTNPLEKIVSNQEEIFPGLAFENDQGKTSVHELPLVGFTLLTQMAVGMAVGMAAYGSMLPHLTVLARLSIGILLLLGGAVSFLHLGRKRNAWRAVIHLKKSWLSREILMAGLFGITWVMMAGWEWLRKETPALWPMSILGFGLIYCMSRVYFLRSVPSWNTWRTPAAFLLSTLTLGALGVRLAVPLPGWEIIVGSALVAELVLALSVRPAVDDMVRRMRIALLVLAIIQVVVTATAPQVPEAGMIIMVFIITLAAEAIGRWQFYASRAPFLMHVK